MCERLFSYGKKVVGILRARMTPELLESIVPNGKQTFMGPEDVGRDAKAVPNNEEDEFLPSSWLLTMICQSLEKNFRFWTCSIKVFMICSER